MRCDLHVHSVHSGRVNMPLLRHIGNECYAEPEQVYDACLERGMNLVTITDHDTIEGGLRIAGRPGAFLSEEVTCALPGGGDLHLGVFGLSERQHDRLAALRSDGEALFAFLAEQRLAAAVNHPFSAITSVRDCADLLVALRAVGVVETVNGSISRRANALAQRVGARLGLGTVGGSDAHALESVARSWTHVPAARTPEEFLGAVQRGHGLAEGRSGTYLQLTLDVLRVVAAGYRDLAQGTWERLSDGGRLAALILGSPLLLSVPLITATRYAREDYAGQRLFRLLQQKLSTDTPGMAPTVGADWRAARLPAGS